MADWNTYYSKHLSRPPRSLLVKAVSFCKNKDIALDLGAGTLIESKFLLDSGFKKVVAVDKSPEIKTFTHNIDDERLEIQVKPFQSITLLPKSFDLISAQYALPFHGPKGFEEYVAKLISSLKTGGVFVGQFFGERDGWNTSEQHLAFQTRDEALKLLKDLRIEELTEEEKDGTTASGEAKRWHVFNFIAVK